MFFDKHRFDEMFHVKHFIFVIVLFICLTVNTNKAYAYTNNFNYLFIDNQGNNTVAWFYVKEYIHTEYKWLIIKSSSIINFDSASGYWSMSYGSSFSDSYFINNDYISYDNPFNYYDGSVYYWTGTQSWGPYDVQRVIVLNGNVTGFENTVTWDEYQEESNPLWYKSIWRIFKTGFSTGTDWIKTQIDNIGTIVSNWWDDITHGSHGGGHSFGNKYLTVNQATPTPIPTITPRPTPIPYSTVLQDDGNGNTTIIYQYNNPQGTPTASPYNPNQYTYYNTDINITGGDRNNPIYVQDVGNVNFSDLIDIANNSIEVNIGDLDSSTDMFTVPLEETAENVGEAVSGFSALPDDLFILIGCIACIPLIAGIIGRLLK